MPIQLPPHAEAVIQEKGTSEVHANLQQAIEAAVRLLEEHDRRLKCLRALIAEGEKGEVVPWTPELTDQISRAAEE